MEPLSNENESSTPLQRLAIGAGALIVVILTVIAAVFLAMQDIPQEEVTPVVQVSPTATAVVTPLPPSPTPTAPTPVPPLTDTPTATPLPPVEETEAPPTPTDTPRPVPPTFTPTPVVIVITATPLPPTPTTVICQPPPTWVEYVVQTGDTLNSLAVRTNVSVYDLQQANCLDSFTILPGQTIYLPFTPPTPTSTPTRAPTGTPRPTPTRTPTAIAPVINNVVPDRVDEDNEGVIITVLGRNFRPRESGFRVELRGPQNLVLQLDQARSDTSFDAIVPPGLPVGIYDLVVTNPNNRAGVRESAFIIGEAPDTPTPVPGPKIDDVNPEEGFNNTDIIIEVKGKNFRPNEPGFQVQLRIGQETKADLELVGSASSTSFSAIVPAGLPPDIYDLWVINPDGKEDVEPAAYESKAP